MNNNPLLTNTTLRQNSEPTASSNELASAKADNPFPTFQVSNQLRAICAGLMLTSLAGAADLPSVDGVKNNPQPAFSPPALRQVSLSYSINWIAGELQLLQNTSSTPKSATQPLIFQPEVLKKLQSLPDSRQPIDKDLLTAAYSGALQHYLGQLSRTPADMLHVRLNFKQNADGQANARSYRQILRTLQPEITQAIQQSYFQGKQAPGAKLESAVVSTDQLQHISESVALWGRLQSIIVANACSSVATEGAGQRNVYQLSCISSNLASAINRANWVPVRE